MISDGQPSPAGELSPAGGKKVVDAASGAEYKDADWLLQQPATRYTLQLLGVQKEVAAKRFIRRQQTRENMAYFRTLRENRPWYVVVYGLYPDRAAALAARSRLPGQLGEGGAWPRSLASIHTAIRAQ